MTVDGQTVEQVLGDLRAALADRREIHPLVPVVQLIEQLEELAGLRGAERNASSAAPAIRTSSDTSTDLHHRAPGDRTFDVRPERLRQLVETEGARDDRIEVARLQIAREALPTARRSGRGVNTELMPSRFTPRRMKGTTVPFSSGLAARPMLAMLPQKFVVRVSHVSTSPPRLSIAPPHCASSSGREPRLSPSRNRTRVVPSFCRYSVAASCR